MSASSQAQIVTDEEAKKPRSRSPGVTHKSEQLATAAHELRGPVGAIVLFAEILDEESDQLSASQQELLSNILSAGELVLKLIDDLLAVSTRRLRLSLEPVDLVSLANECISLQSPAANRKSIRLALECDVQLPSVRLDRLKILRVVNELLANAIQFSNIGQSVELRLSIRGRVAEIEVRDEGPGISQRDQRVLFVPFHKNARDTAPAGRGIGLAIAKTIVGAHQGRIRVKSQPGTGSTFLVSLPTGL